jgi:Mrp family chromosome partitioning ATPase
MLRSLLQDGKKTLVIDSAPLLPVADAQILLNKPAVDASVVVARQGVTTRDHARRARLVLDGHGAAPIGLVVTGHTARDVYGYGYGEIWQPDVTQPDLPAGEPPAPMRPGARPAPVAQHSQPQRSRSRSRLSWLRP